LPGRKFGNNNNNKFFETKKINVKNEGEHFGNKILMLKVADNIKNESTLEGGEFCRNCMGKERGLWLTYINILHVIAL
jgi:hypothetical protein